MDTDRTGRGWWFGLCVLALSFADTAVSAPIVVTINTEIVSMALTGTGPMPLGTGASLAVNDGYQDVESTVTATESPVHASTGTTRLTVDTMIDPDNLLNTVITVDTDSKFYLFLDLEFTDVDPTHDYAAGLGDSFTLLADASKPLTIMLSDSVSFSLIDIAMNPDDFPANPGIQAISNTVTRDLGVDINNSGAIDFIQYEAGNFDFGDDLAFDDNVLTDTTADSLVADILAGLIGLGGPDFTFNAEIAVQSGSFIFSGMVADALTDPPFALALSAPTSADIPEPGVLLLFLAGLLGLCATRRRVRPIRQSAS